jgi:hypothetical protein
MPVIRPLDKAADRRGQSSKGVAGPLRRARSRRVTEYSAEAAPSVAGPARLARHVFYIPGYAPEGPERHHALVSREAARFARVWGVEVEVLPIGAVVPGGPATVWTLTTRMPDATVVTTFETLAWEDFVRADFQTSLRHKLAEGAATLGDAISSGLLARVWRAAPWFGFAYLYPYLWIFGCLLAGLAVGAGIVAFVPNMLGAALGALVGAGVFAAALRALQGSGLFAIHLLDDWCAQRRYRLRSDLAFEARLDAFAARVSEIDQAGTSDEILVVGHSSGSFLAIDVVARAFEADDGFGARRSQIALLTVGVAELLVAFHPGAGWLRDRIARLASEERLFWAEVAGRFDALNFHRRSPIVELGLDEAAPNPRFVRTRLNDMLERAKVVSIIRALNAFRIHFQFVMANDKRAPYDFFSLVCGARTASAQFRRRAGETMAPWA